MENRTALFLFPLLFLVVGIFYQPGTACAYVPDHPLTYSGDVDVSDYQQAALDCYCSFKTGDIYGIEECYPKFDVTFQSAGSGFTKTDLYTKLMKNSSYIVYWDWADRLAMVITPKPSYFCGFGYYSSNSFSFYYDYANPGGSEANSNGTKSVYWNECLNFIYSKTDKKFMLIGLTPNQHDGGRFQADFAVSKKLDCEKAVVYTNFAFVDMDGKTVFQRAPLMTPITKAAKAGLGKMVTAPEAELKVEVGVLIPIAVGSVLLFPYLAQFLRQSFLSLSTSKKTSRHSSRSSPRRSGKSHP